MGGGRGEARQTAVDYPIHAADVENKEPVEKQAGKKDDKSAINVVKAPANPALGQKKTGAVAPVFFELHIRYASKSDSKLVI
ncbi:hypothetical protein [Silvimonas soli]|uniref:hypothetical protein n=1 Tax=Silvimonas soli TaxID=2980100 RepID=UPI0024B39A38|nr:hypothetical protein [Silvimonas soli]